MLKRNLTMLIAVGLLGANVNLATAGESTFPPSTDDVLYELLPAQAKYLADREAAIPAPTGATGSAFPRTSNPGRAPLPAEVKYFDQRQASLQAEKAGERTLTTTAATKYLNVAHEETVRIVNEKGQSFVWTANTFGEADLPLQAIAPRDFVAGQTRVFVRHPYEHTIID